MKKYLALLCCTALAPAWAGDRPLWLPEEFNTPEEFAAAYQKIRQQQTATPAAPTDASPLPVAESVPAEESAPGKDFSVSIGTKVWLNRWDSSLTTAAKYIAVGLPDQSTLVSAETTSDLRPLSKASEEATAIPSLTLRYRNFFVTGNYYTPTTFSFSENATQNIQVSQTANLAGASGTGQQSINSNATNERSEWDVSAGWLLHPNVAITAGYKRIDQKVITDTDYRLRLGFDKGFLTDQTFTQADFDTSGATLGIASSVPIAELFNGITGLYLSYNHGFFDTNGQVASTTTFAMNGPAGPYENNSTSNNATDYNVIEAGFTYNLGSELLPAYLPMSSAGIYAGYRYQWIEVQDGDFKDRTDITQGFVAGLNLNF
jgi:hypothetical protein